MRFPFFCPPPSLPPSSPSSSSRSLSSFLVPAGVSLPFLPLSPVRRPPPPGPLRGSMCLSLSSLRPGRHPSSSLLLALFFPSLSLYISLSLLFSSLLFSSLLFSSLLFSSLSLSLSLSLLHAESHCRSVWERILATIFLIVLLLMAIGVLDALFLQELYVFQSITFLKGFSPTIFGSARALQSLFYSAAVWVFHCLWLRSIFGHSLPKWCLSKYYMS